MYAVVYDIYEDIVFQCPISTELAAKMLASSIEVLDSPKEGIRIMSRYASERQQELHASSDYNVCWLSSEREAKP